MKLEKINWYYNRLKSMNIPEIIWRIEQKCLEKKEKNIFFDNDIQVISEIFNKDLIQLLNDFDYEKYFINFNNKNFEISNDLWLFEKYQYNKLKDKWHYGFDTNNYWDRKFSYNLSYKQNDSIGDARTNWELNRHFQFVNLAKNYFITKEKEYIDEFKYLFYDWNESNPFLKGISWTSVMEVAIRAYSWIISLVFLYGSSIEDEKLMNDLKVGIINMVDYTNKHHSRYSSANNHLIVEMVVLGITGVLFNHKEWYIKAIEVLNKELFIQNYSDGVNKEHALHYQTFVMEAVSLFILVLRRNSIKYPKSWNQLLIKMSEFISDNMDENYNVSHLGDSDEGKILDLSGKYTNHYKYVLELTSLLLDKQYVNLNDVHENINWLFEANEINSNKIIYNNKLSKCYKEGGYTIMKSMPSYKNKILIVIDHAELGFGSIAAHGHADSLSFTMNVNGNRVFIDPGTYIYHINLELRDYFRKTINHNTVCINNKDQSEMLGAFLWGKRANTILNKYEQNQFKEILEATHDGYKPIMHTRRFEYNRKNIIEIRDEIIGKNFDWISTLVLDPKVIILNKDRNKIKLKIDKHIVNVEVNKGFNIEIEEIWISEIYSNKIKSKSIKIRGYSKESLNLNMKIVVD